MALLSKQYSRGTGRTSWNGKPSRRSRPLQPYSTGEAVDPFGKDASYIDPIGETGPYYAVKGAAYIYGTIGGLDVDINMNVLDETRKPIPGLYAVGQDSMGVLFTPQDAYVSYGGAAHGWVLTSGRIAGANAAEYVMSK